MIGIYILTNCSAVIIEDIIYDIDEYVLARFVVNNEDRQRQANKHKIYYDDNSRAYFSFGGAKIYLDEVIKVGE